MPEPNYDPTSPIAQLLKHSLAEIYYSHQYIENLLLTVDGLGPQHVNMTGSSEVIWGQILNEARNRCRLSALLTAILNDERSRKAKEIIEKFLSNHTANIELTVPPKTINNISQQTIRDLELVTGKRPSFLDMSYLEDAIRVSKSVVKLLMKYPGGIEAAGTGFLIGPGLLMTNHHNLFYEGRQAKTIEAIFDYESRDIKRHIVELDPLKSKYNIALDVAIIPIDCPDHRTPLKFSINNAHWSERVAIIQHPNGDFKKIALNDNYVVGVNAMYTQYLVDTDYGSSGAPVLNDSWRVVALHHAHAEHSENQSQKIYLNEGVNITSIRNWMNNFCIEDERDGWIMNNF